MYSADRQLGSVVCRVCRIGQCSQLGLFDLARFLPFGTETAAPLCRVCSHARTNTGTMGPADLADWPVELAVTKLAEIHADGLRTN